MFLLFALYIFCAIIGSLIGWFLVWPVSLLFVGLAVFANFSLSGGHPDGRLAFTGKLIKRK